MKILEIKNGACGDRNEQLLCDEGGALLVASGRCSAYPPEQADHWKVPEILVSARVPGQGVAEDRRHRRRPKTGTRVEAEYRAPMLRISRWNRWNGICRLSPALRRGSKIWVGHRALPVRRCRSSLIGLKPEQVILHNQWTGGSFGTTVSVTEYLASFPRSPI